MNRQIFNEIYDSFHPATIAHIKTINGDKICIKDNQENQRTGISLQIKDEYVDITAISLSEKNEKHITISIPYNNIVQIESQLTVNSDSKNPLTSNKEE